MLDKIVVFAGKMGSGKTTLANLLYDELTNKGVPCYKVSFSTLLKRALGLLLKTSFISNDKLKNESVIFKNNLISCRSLLQNLGDIIRSADKDYFVRHVGFELKHYKKGVAIIDDLRFYNELQPLVSFAKHLYIVTIEKNYTRNDNTAETIHASENFDGLKSFIRNFYAKHNCVDWLQLESFADRDTSRDKDLLLEFVSL